MLDESILDLVFAIYSFIIVFVFAKMRNKTRILYLWFYGTLTNAIGTTIFYFRQFNDVYRIIGNIFYFFTAIILAISIFQEYFNLFGKKKLRKGIKNLFLRRNIIFMAFSTILINIIQLSLSGFIVIISVLLFKIFKKEKSITHAFMFLAVFASFLTLIFSVLHNFKIDSAWEMAYILKLIFLTAVLATGLSAPIEERLNQSESQLRESYNRAEFYKDLFAHDMNNILQAIQSSMEILSLNLEKSNKFEEIYRLYDIVLKQVKRGAKLVLNVRKLSELDKIEIHIKPIEISEILKEVIKNVKKSEEKRKIEIHTNYDEKELYVQADELIINVFENLMDNAIKYNNSPTAIININITNVQVKNKNYLKIEFIDNGIGVPEEMKEIIFQRTELQKKTTRGMGLGLSLIRKIIAKYQGKIWVENRIEGDYSQGSKFVILIPQA